ncbi:hypothetical protein M9H77_12898 [Catharanthus roseus]|uniref:Uncharacterized protein n=1 Tax=Catharanthus roseus TaxID=4058 RepID=A0ACC0BIV4_CATRO|nr:hypothetical protein M9H77_12898 [Catharanthus roseus]
MWLYSTPFLFFKILSKISIFPLNKKLRVEGFKKKKKFVAKLSTIGVPRLQEFVDYCNPLFQCRCSSGDDVFYRCHSCQSLGLLVPAFNIWYILGENLDFDNPLLPETLCPVFYPVDCLCLEDRMLNYKEHLSKSPCTQPDKNLIDMFVYKFSANIYLEHKHLVLYRFLYIMQEHENKKLKSCLPIAENPLSNFLAYHATCTYNPFEVILALLG